MRSSFNLSRHVLLAAAFVVATALPCARAGTYDAPVSPTPQPGVASTLAFFHNISGQYVVSGQQEIAWDQNRKDEDFNYIIQQTGKTPALRGFDFLEYVYTPGNGVNWDATERAIAWSKQQGGLVSFCCHMFMTIGSPAGQPQFYVPAANNGNGTTFDIRQAVIDGTPENQEMLQKFDIIAAELQKLRDAGVTVIWRPFHECSGNWFWWGAHGPDPLKKAWRIMFDRFTRTHGLNNLIWCFNPTDPIATNLPAWYPGDDVVDMISIDVYDSGHSTRGADFRTMVNFTQGRKPVVMSENGPIPDPAVMFGSSTDAAGWGYFCTWNGFENDVTKNSVAFLQSVYSNAHVITLDRLGPIYAANSLAISTPPQSQLVTAGTTLTLNVTTNGGTNVTYQWFKDGTAISGATAASYAVSNVTTDAAGTYTVAATSGSYTTTSVPADVAVAPAGAHGSSLVNIATRAHCGTDANVTIGGFVVTGTSAKQVLVRAVGPSLAAQGLAASEVLADPTVKVFHNGTVIATNDNWTDDADNIKAVAKAIGATALLDSDTKSAAMLITLQPGVYSFIASGAGNSSGIVLLEVYDAQTSDPGAHFVNIATRAYSTTGAGVTIGGFVITGDSPKRVLLRAVGPSLAAQGLDASALLADPAIELHHGSATIATNDDWGANANAAEIRSTGARIGATPLQSTDSTSSALLLYLQPGAYTFIAAGKGGASGIVLVEVYDAD